MLKLCARCWNRAAAAGRRGASSGLKSDRILMKYCERGSSPAPLVAPGISRSNISGGALSVRQSPERLGLPSAARGVRAERLGLPSGVLGIPAVRWFNHCAHTNAGAAAKAIRMTRMFRLRIPLAHTGLRFIFLYIT